MTNTYRAYRQEVLHGLLFQVLLMYFTYINLLNLHNYVIEMGNIIIPILQKTELKHSGIKQLAQRPCPMAGNQ